MKLSKYKWSRRRHWLNWLKMDFLTAYYSIVYGFNVDVRSISSTMLPSVGKGKYISVYSKGKIIQIKHERGYEHLGIDEVRIIPFKHNHGVMVERFKNGKMLDRNILDLAQFDKSIIFASNIEELTKNKD